MLLLFADRMKSLTPSPNVVDMNLKISHIECHPECVVIVFKGQCKVGCELDYYILQNEMQRVFKVKDNVDIGGSCLVEDADGKWHRGKVLEKKENICKAFLIDTGQVLVVEEIHIASAGDDFFQLPPKVVCGIFANILPLGEKWSPKAINYFSSLVGLQITGHVKSVTSYQLFILEVPKVISDILELQLGKLIDGDSFCLIVEMLKVLPPETLRRVPQLLQQKRPVQELLTFTNSEKPSDFWPVPDLFPHLPAGSKVNVKITVAISLSKFYCQIQERQKELENLTEAMSLYYEAISTENNTSFDSLGLLCAAKRQNGQWHRGVIKQLLPKCVEVWFMDLGNIETVPSSCVQKLTVEFMSLPMISFPCALSCFGSQDEAVINLQLKTFIQALTGQTSVCVCVDLFNASKHLYYITLKNQDFGINAKHPENLNEAAASLVPPLETKISSIGVSYKASVWSSSKNRTGNKQTKNCLPEWDRSLSRHCKRVKMQMNTYYIASVVYVINPSNFWIQTCAYQKEFQALMNSIADAYNHCGADDWVLENPEPGLLCCARYSKDKHYYRGVVTEVLHVSITVYFLDFGNTDTVPGYDVKTLLPEFAALPALAVCCELACTSPVEDVWVKKETDFFKQIVFNKLLLFQVIGEQNNKYIVNARCRNALQEINVATFMAQAGYAEYWERRPVSAQNLSKKHQAQNSLQLKQNYVNARCTSDIYKNNVSQNRQVFQQEKTVSASSRLRKSVMPSSFGKDALSESHQVRSQSFSQVTVPEKKILYKELVFKPGAVFEVVCSYSVSPTEFSCQLQSKLPELNTLMKQIQTYYKEHTIPYKNGQVACVVKCPKDGKWYRASVLQQVSTNEVDVVFVDYGYRERVLLNDLQAVLPDFLTLESQAFQCALKNVPLQTDALNWSEEKCRLFNDFISAAGGPLTCTVYALVLLRPNCLCNIVDLQTPFISPEGFLRECGLNQSECIGLQRLAPLGSMYSFYYSSFNVEIGSEEEVYITHIHSPSKFYCQLNRNSATIEALSRNVTEISKMANHAKYDTISTRLCIARYFEDGQFYRALVSPVGSTSYLCADFVDFGNKHMVETDQLMPIPDSATDLILTPMQAIKCCLSDLKDTKFPARVIRWFEETFLGKLLKAVIVSRESDGQIVVQLYDGQLHVGQKVEEKLLEELAYVTNYTEQFVGSYEVIQYVENNGEVSFESPERIQLKNKLEFQVDNEYYQADNGENFGDEEQITRRTQNQCCGSSKPVTSEGSEEPGFLKPYSAATEHREKSLDGKSASQSLCHPSLSLKEITVNVLSESRTEQLNYTGQQERDNENIPKLISLPQRDIQVNSEVAGYISHINSPSSFYIQFAEDENLVIQLAEELNESMVNIGHENGLGELMVGDLILAEFAIDCFYYRAVIKTLKSGNSFEVEFIDYGNTAVVSLSKICRIQKKLLTLPRLSIHCFLSTVNSAPDESWTNESTSYFVNKTNNKLVTCKFLEQDGEQWKVDIICDGNSISDGFQQKSGRTSLQNKQMQSWEQVSKQILLTNGNPQDGNSVSDLGGQRKNQTARMENNSKMCLNVPPQDLNTEQIERAEIINASAGGEFHVQLLKNLQILNDLNVMLVKEAQRSGLLVADNIEEGLECMVKSERNLKWYRSKVIKMFIRERLMLVFFIDYGIYEMVSLNNAKILSDEIKSIPKQAVLCEWVWLKKMSKVPFVHVVNTLLNGGIRILFLRYLESSHIWEVDILVGKVLLQKYLNQLLTTVVEPEKSINTDCMEEFQKSFGMNSITWTLLQSGRKYSGFATAVTDPSNFSVQFEDLFDSMKTLSLLLSDVPDDLPALPEELVFPGNSCLIQFGLEAQWNRVQISEVTSQSVLITFIDYGFLKSIPCSEIHRLKVIPESLSVLPHLAYSCSLHGIVPATGEYWSDEAKFLFQKLLSKPNLIFHFKHYGSGMRLEVDILYEENNLGCALVAAGHAVYSAGRCCPIPVDEVESTCLQPNYPNSNCGGFLCEPDHN